MVAEAGPVVRPRRILIVANPWAGLRRGRPAGERAAREAERAGARVELHLTRGPGDAREAAAAAARDGVDLVLAVGGDGTLHEAANGVAGTSVPVGVAPAGTMNLLARVVGVPLDAGDAASRVASGFRPLSITPGEAGGRVFLLMAGAGFDAWVLRELLEGRRGKIGFAAYARGAIRGLRTFPFDPLTIVRDGVSRRAHSVIVGRAPLYGGFLRPTPGVSLTDDTLEVCELDGGALALAALLPALWSGAHAGRRGATLSRARSVTIGEAPHEVPYQLDGEMAGRLPVTIGLSARRVALALPAAR